MAHEHEVVLHLGEPRELQVLKELVHRDPFVYRWADAKVLLGIPVDDEKGPPRLEDPPALRQKVLRIGIIGDPSQRIHLVLLRVQTVQENAPIKQVLNQLPLDKQIRKHAPVTVNGRLEKRSYRLCEGDELALVLPTSGG